MMKHSKKVSGRSRSDSRGGNPPQSGLSRQVGALRFDDERAAIAVDGSKVLAPDRVYDADVAWIEHRAGAVSIFFAKINRDEAEAFSSRLEVRYAPEDFIITFWSHSARFADSLTKFVAKWPAEAMSSTFSENWPARQAHSEWASYTQMSHSGTASTVDFSYLAPSGLARYAQTRDITGAKITPVVRIQLTAFTLHGLLERARELNEVIRTYLPQEFLQREIPIEADPRKQESEETREYGS
jgi:hypothetical protein